MAVVAGRRCKRAAPIRSKAMNVRGIVPRSDLVQLLAQICSGRLHHPSTKQLKAEALQPEGKAGAVARSGILFLE